MLTPNHLKFFRSHFCLTQKQAAALLLMEKRAWWRLEHGLDTIPVTLQRRLKRWSEKLTRKLAYQTNFCPFCRKSVAKARASNLPRCPYCYSLIVKNRKRLVAFVLPAEPRKGRNAHTK